MGDVKVPGHSPTPGQKGVPAKLRIDSTAKHGSAKPVGTSLYGYHPLVSSIPVSKPRAGSRPNVHPVQRR